MRIILKINVNGSIEPFTTLPELFKVHPQIEKHKESIITAISRKKREYKGDGFVISRQIVNSETVVLS